MSDLPGTWTEPDGEVLDRLTHQACLAADMVAIGFQGTGADRTRATLRTGLRMLLANGLIMESPRESWPEWIKLDPPSEGGRSNQP